MPPLVSRNVRQILGTTGSGKTTLAREFVKALPRALILDSGFCEFPAMSFTDIRQLHEYLDANAGAGGNFRASFTPLMSEVPTLFQWAREIGAAEEFTLVLEECDRFSTRIPGFEDLVQRGRHYGVHMLGISTHPYAIDIDFRRQATEIFSFRQHEPADIKWLSAVMNPEAVDAITKLGAYEFIRWNSKTGAIDKGRTKL